MKEREKVATLNVNEINDEIARIKPLLDDAWEKIRDIYSAEGYEEQEFNYNYGFKCDPLLENTIRLQCRYDYLKKQLKEKDKEEEMKNEIEAKVSHIRDLIEEAQYKKNEIEAKVSHIRDLIEEAQYKIDWFIDDLADELRKANPSDYDEDDELFFFWQEIKCLKNLCDELEIDVPPTCDVYLREDFNYRIETIEGVELTVCTDIEAVICFLSGWVLGCANSVFQQAENRIGNLLYAGC